MKLPSEFTDLICALNEEHVDYIVVGAHAMAQHGMPRYTGDIDFFFRRTEQNSESILLALVRFGVRPAFITIESLMTPETVHYLGHPPFRIDFLNTISGVTFDEAWHDRVILKNSDPVFSVLSIQHLLKNKQASGRLKDLADVELIQRKLDENA